MVLSPLRWIPLLLLLLPKSTCNALLVSSSTTSRTTRTRQHHQRTSQTRQHLSIAPRQSHRKRRDRRRKQDYEHRKQQWLERYGSLEALQSTFGTGETKPLSSSFLSSVFNGGHQQNNNNSGGDLTPEQTRRLYHTLLPRSLLALYELRVMEPSELAPLAYEARVAAKAYARSRCVWYARFATELFDRYRRVRDRHAVANKRGSLTWDELWSKYEAQIVQEECKAVLEYDDDTTDDVVDLDKDQKKNKPNKNTLCLDEKELTMRIYLRILEKSCATNQAFDQMFLTTSGDSNDKDDDDAFSKMARQLDHDVRDILLHPKESAKASRRMARRERKRQKMQQKEEQRRFKALRKLRRRQERKRKRRKLPQNEAMEHVETKEEEASKAALDAATDNDDDDANKNGAISGMEGYRWRVLRILAGTRKHFRRLL